MRRAGFDQQTDTVRNAHDTRFAGRTSARLLHAPLFCRSVYLAPEQGLCITAGPAHQDRGSVREAFYSLISASGLSRKAVWLAGLKPPGNEATAALRGSPLFLVPRLYLSWPTYPRNRPSEPALANAHAAHTTAHTADEKHRG